MKIYPNAYYNYKKQCKKEYYETKKQQQQVILDIYHTYEGRPGYRMMQIFLARRNILLSRPTVLKYMTELNIRSVVIRKKPHYQKGECYRKFDNLLKQNFKADRPNEKWCTDFTYLYLSNGAKRYV